MNESLLCMTYAVETCRILLIYWCRRSERKSKDELEYVQELPERAIIEQRADRKDPNKKYNHVKKFLPKAKKEYKAGSF